MFPFLPAQLRGKSLVLCLFASAVSIATAQSGQWTGTWAAAPFALPNAGGTWGASGTAGTTLREIAHISIPGSTVRVTLTNEFGTEPLIIGAAQIGLRGSGSAVMAGTTAPLLFAGHPTITIPAGALVVSDPVALKLPAFADVAVSIFVPSQTISIISRHPFADQTNYLVAGNTVSAPSLEGVKEVYAWDFLKGIDVQSSAGAVVCFGDSITDGAHSTRDANARWPDVLARRLAADKKASPLAVLNEGIGGNRVLRFGTGPSALTRFDRDVLAQDGVRYLVILESINDIGHSFDPKSPRDPVTADDLITGLTQLAERAHAHGIKVYGATLTPYGGAGYMSSAGEAVRAAVNQWIRTTREFDGVLDFDKVTRDPTNPTAFLPAYDSGDHLHPSDAGYKAMGESIDLRLFER